MAKTHEQRLKSRNELRQNRKTIQELGWEFRLSATGLVAGEEQVARVRRISLMDQASIDQIPRHLQDIVNDGLDYIEKEQKRVTDEGLSTETLADRVKNNTRVLPAADAFCIATFTDPILVQTEAEAIEFEQRRKPGDDRQVWVVGEDLDPADRIDWFWACLNADSEAAKKLKPFRHKSPIDVQSRTVGDDNGQATAPAPEAAQGEEPRTLSILQG